MTVSSGNRLEVIIEPRTRLQPGSTLAVKLQFPMSSPSGSLTIQQIGESKQPGTLTVHKSGGGAVHLTNLRWTCMATATFCPVAASPTSDGYQLSFTLSSASHAAVFLATAG